MEKNARDPHLFIGRGDGFGGVPRQIPAHVRSPRRPRRPATMIARVDSGSAAVRTREGASRPPAKSVVRACRLPWVAGPHATQRCAPPSAAGDEGSSESNTAGGSPPAKSRKRDRARRARRRRNPRRERVVCRGLPFRMQRPARVRPRGSPATRIVRVDSGGPVVRTREDASRSAAANSPATIGTASNSRHRRRATLASSPPSAAKAPAGTCRRPWVGVRARIPRGARRRFERRRWRPSRPGSFAARRAHHVAPETIERREAATFSASPSRPPPGNRGRARRLNDDHRPRNAPGPRSHGAAHRQRRESSGGTTPKPD